MNAKTRTIGIVAFAVVAALSIVAAVFPGKCRSPRPENIVLPEREPPQRTAIVAALRALLDRTNRDAFVIFQDKSSGKFVQFAGSAGEPLFLDLPAQALNDDESKRAAKLFRELAAKSPAGAAVRPEGGETRGFQLRFGRDAERAAEAALRVFREGYRLPADFELSIEEN